MAAKVFLLKEVVEVWCVTVTKRNKVKVGTDRKSCRMTNRADAIQLFRGDFQRHAVVVPGHQGWGLDFRKESAQRDMDGIPEIPYEPDLRNSIHTLSVAEVYQALASGPNGLSLDEVENRRRRFGLNTIREVQRKPLFIKFLANFTHLMAILLWVGGVFAFVARLPQLGWAIWAVVVINAVFSFWQEFKAEKAMEALRRLLPITARVLRGGEEQRIPAEELVPGDILLLSEGDHISADGRLIQESELRVDHSTLSGESHPVKKTRDALSREGGARTDMTNLVFAGTTVVSGNGRAVVFAVGMDTEFGKIAHLTLGLGDELSPLQREINRMTRVVTGMAVGIGIVFFLLSVLVVHRPVSSGFIFAVGMIVAFVPEGLLPTVTLALAMGVQRMARRNALIKKLSSVETLGCCTVICTDKTGTLTQNEMTVRWLRLADSTFAVTGIGYDPSGKILDADTPLSSPLPEDVGKLLLGAGLCNNSRIVSPAAPAMTWTVLGDPTEAALKLAVRKGGIDLDVEEEALPRLREIPFDSRRKRMSTIHRTARRDVDREYPGAPSVKAPSALTAFVKGAPKEILELCTRVRKGGREEYLNDHLRAEIMAANDAYARDGLRVLAVAMRSLECGFSDFSPEAVERDLTFLGLAAMMDPPRAEVTAAVEKCRRAGIRIIMITGDYGLTAESIALRIGVVRERVRILSPGELEAMDDESLRTVLSEEVICARFAPEHKLRVVSALQGMGHVVAVTGDGVNDAPALKKGDIGIAMGIAGTDVAKESADMVLTDDNFASIVNAIEEGRAVYSNIKKFATYIFTSNMPEAWPFILQILMNIPLALPVMQILAIDLGTDMLPALALGAENPEPGVMDAKPRSQKDRLVDGFLLLRAIVWQGSLMTLFCFAGFFYLYWLFGYRDFLKLPRFDLLPYAERLADPGGQVYVLATTIFFAGVVATQIGNAYACRTERTSVFTIGFFGNRFLLAGILAEVSIVALLMYLPPLRTVFELAPLPLRFWGFICLFPPLLFLAEEGRKALARRHIRRKSVSRGTP
jgi:magnesium-transporting ATPase (P-type)